MYGLKDTYDLAFSIGGACACSQSLRRAGMQYASFPYDWAGFPSVPGKARLLAADFKDLMPIDKMTRVGINTEKQKDIYENVETGMVFLHDFPQGVPISEVHAEVEAKYRRRAERLKGMLEHGGNVLVVYTAVPTDAPLPDADLMEAVRILSERFPEAQFDFLCFSQKAGEPFKAADVRRLEGTRIFRSDFDFQTKSLGSEHIANDRLVAQALRQLVRKVVDYRTREEKAQYRIARRQKEWKLYHAKGTLQYFQNKILWKLYKHFRNKLERRGFEL